MKIAMLCGSPKLHQSTSGLLLRYAGEQLPEYEQVSVHAAGAFDTSSMAGSEVILLAFPLYTDGIPGHLLRWMQEMERYCATLSGAAVYAVANIGFYEPQQSKNALAQVRHWCGRAGLVWGQGLGIGCGSMMQYIPNLHVPLLAPVRLAVDELLQSLLARKTGEDLYATPRIPRAIYMQAANRHWAQQAARNHLSRADLGRKI